MKKAKTLILSMIIGICLMLFVLLAVLANMNKQLQIDSFMFNMLGKISTKGVVNFFKILTAFGSIYALGVIALSTFFLKNKIYGLTNCLVLGFSAVLCVVVKYIIRRPRPEVSHIEEVSYSFPSAHAMLTFVVLGFVIFIVIKHLKNKPLKIVMSSILAVLIVAIGLSRVLLGVHYFTDVLAGWVMATPILVLGINFCNYLIKNHSKKINKMLM